MMKDKPYFLYRLNRACGDSEPLYVVAASSDDLKSRIGTSYFEQFADITLVGPVTSDIVRAIFQFVISEFC